MTKYSIPDDHEWADEKEAQEDVEDRVRIDDHRVDVIHVTDPDEMMGYGRDKYTAHLAHRDETDPSVVFFTKHRWKGNYWRDHLQLDWQDVPYLVRREVAQVVECDGVDSLAPGMRLIDEGGEETWRRHTGEGASEECPECGGSGEADDDLPEPDLRRCPRKGCSVVTFRAEVENDD